MTLIIILNGLLFCMESHLFIQLRRKACRNIEGRCVKRKRDCPKRLPLETQPGRPYCSKKRRCCYPDIDECKVNSGGCEHICTNTEGSYHCSCRDGFTLSDDQRSCTDTSLGSSGCEFICNDISPVNITTCEDMEFRLYNSSNKHYDILIANNNQSVDSSSFNSSLPLLVVAHGYRENATTSTWMHQVKNKWLEKMPMNVILVQWAELADITDYCQAVRNTKCVGTKLANLINFLVSYTNLSPLDTHIIGFSLGGQLAGVAGHQVNNLARITGLDPAGPGFYNVDLSDRLDKEDASFVDVIHTSGGCIEDILSGIHLGFLPPCGHVDFYMNGGSFQNGCPTFSLMNISDECVTEPLHCMADIVDYLACSHRRAHEYYVESLTASEPSYGYQCEDYETFQNGSCLNNLNNTIGYGVTYNPIGKFYSNTQANTTYLTRSIAIHLLVSEDPVEPFYYGYTYVGAILPNRTEEIVDLMKGYETGVYPGTNLTRLVTVPTGTNLSTIKISAQYNRSFHVGPDTLKANYIEAFDAFNKEWYCVSGATELKDTVKVFSPTSNPTHELC